MRRKKGMWQFDSYDGAEKDSKNRRRRSLADYTCGEPFKKIDEITNYYSSPKKKITKQ